MAEEIYAKTAVSAIIVAAGSSRRMQGQDKLWIPLVGRPAIVRVLDVFQTSPLITHIVIVTSVSKREDIMALCKQENWDKVRAVVVGGEHRQASVRAGLEALSQTTLSQWVFVHDGARPLVSHEMLQRGFQAAQKYLAATAAVPAKDTMKIVQDEMIVTTLDRSCLWSIQTPQVFSYTLLEQAHRNSTPGLVATDDASLIENIGHPVAIFVGSYTNIKITTSEDIMIAETFLRRLAQ